MYMYSKASIISKSIPRKIEKFLEIKSHEAYILKTSVEESYFAHNKFELHHRFLLRNAFAENCAKLNI